MLSRSSKSSGQEVTGNGQDIWKALTKKYTSHGKEARTTCHEKLVSTGIEPSQNPNGFFFVLDEYRQLFEDKG